MLRSYTLKSYSFNCISKWHLHSKCHCTHIWHKSLKNMTASLQIQFKLPYEPTFLHTCTKIQPTVIPTSHVTSKYVQEKTVPTNLGIHATNLMNLYGTHIQIYVPLMKSLASTMWQVADYIILTYITKKVWLPHCNYNSHN